MGVYIGPLRFTKRGIRFRIGPRIFRYHGGAGGRGVSTGAGPVSVYRRIGRRHRHGR